MSSIDPSAGFYGSTVDTGNGASNDGRVNFGGVRISATDVAHFIMMHRSVTLKEIGAERTAMAQHNLDRIKKGRQTLIDLGDLMEFAKTEKSFRDRCPVTPDMVKFLKEEVNCAPNEHYNRVVFYGSAVNDLPMSVRNYYGLYDDGNGGWVKYSERSVSEFDFTYADGNNEYEMSGCVIIDHTRLPELRTQVNNYIDQLNDSNNLFMTKFKNVVNLMNTALESANSLADKSHDMTKNLVSRW